MIITPIVQDNSILKNGEHKKLTIRDLRILTNEKWGAKIGVKLLELVFETECGRIIVKKVPYSFDPNSDISKIYEAATGKVIDVERGFDSSEIIGKSILSTVSKYESKGYVGTTVINFRGLN